MFWSKEDWLKIALQMVSLYLLAVGVNILLLKSGEPAFIMLTEIAMIPLVGIAYLIRKKIHSFLKTIMIIMGVSYLYGLITWLVIKDIRIVVTTSMIIIIYSFFVCYNQTSIHEFEYIPEQFILVPIVIYSMTFWLKAPELRLLCSVLCILFILLQIIYNYWYRMKPVIEQIDLGSDDNSREDNSKQMMLVVKAIAGIACMTTILLMGLYLLLFQDAFTPARRVIASVFHQEYTKYKPRDDDLDEKGDMSDKDSHKGDIDVQETEITVPEEKEEAHHVIPMLYIYFILGILAMGIMIILFILIWKWVSQLRKYYVIGMDEFSPIERRHKELEMVVSKNEKKIEKVVGQMDVQSETKTNEIIKAIKENVGKVIIGKQDVVDYVLVALLSEGHILLEDVPGTGKTVLAKTFAKSIDAGFTRIQFTADLLPSDVTGLNYFNQKIADFTFKKGPIYSNIVLADEINRATPKTQSALIECMEEHQVTVDGKTDQLENPFLVIATENPIEHSGTFPLPEAQLDRFLLKVHMGYPNSEEALQIIDNFYADSPFEHITNVCSKENVMKMIQEARCVQVDESIRRLVVKIIEETRQSDQVEVGASPRSLLAFMRAIRSYAYIKGRDCCCKKDIETMAVPVLAHRIKLKPMNIAGLKNSEDVIREIVWNCLES